MTGDASNDSDENQNASKKNLKEHLEGQESATANNKKKKPRNMSGVGLSDDGGGAAAGDGEDAGGAAAGDGSKTTSRSHVHQGSVFGLSQHAAGTISLIIASTFLCEQLVHFEELFIFPDAQRERRRRPQRW